jgi:hypothetical protein
VSIRQRRAKWNAPFTAGRVQLGVAIVAAFVSGAFSMLALAEWFNGERWLTSFFIALFWGTQVATAVTHLLKAVPRRAARADQPKPFSPVVPPSGDSR